MENDGGNGPLLLPRPAQSEGCALSGVPGFAGLRHAAAGSLPVWRGEAHLRQLPGALLSTRPARTDADGHAACRTPDALAASGFEHPALAGRFPPGAAPAGKFCLALDSNRRRIQWPSSTCQGRREMTNDETIMTKEAPNQTTHEYDSTATDFGVRSLVIDVRLRRRNQQ